mgnify:CR=1 FL=1
MDNLEEVKEDGDYGDEESAQQMSSSSSKSAAEAVNYSLSDMASLAVLAYDSISQHCKDTEMPPLINLHALQTFISGEHGYPTSAGSMHGK